LTDLGFSLHGYFTKYDCSAGQPISKEMPTELTLIPADINPIAGISKTDLKKFIAYARDAFEIPILDELVQLCYY
jgi:NAD+ synthase (glutamine-hydrolysing)